MKPFFVIQMAAMLLSAAFCSGQKISEAKEKARLHADMIAFHRLILQSKEYADEKKNAAKILRDDKVTVKVKITIDTNLETDDEVKPDTLLGYINESLGENSENIIEFIYNRKEKKIVGVKPTGEALQIEKKEQTTPKAKRNAKEPKDPEAMPEEAEEPDENAEKPKKTQEKDED
jgi:hypothetical protein